MTLDQIAGRISANGELGKQDQSGSGGLRAMRERDDLRSVAGKIPNCRVDLPQGNLHVNSVKAEPKDAKREKGKLEGQMENHRHRVPSGTLAPGFGN